MPYVVQDDFRSGLDRRRSPLNAPVNSLYTLKNAHITRGGEIEKRKAFVSRFSLPANTFGLHAVGGSLFVFGSVATPSGMPPGVNYQRLQSPAASAMTRILAAESFDGKIYAVAEYADGNIYHFYDGARVAAWDTKAGSIGSFRAIAGVLAAKIDALDDYLASASNTVITIEGPAGTNYSISTSAVNGAGVNDQLATLATVQAAVAGVAEVLASTSFSVVTGGAGGQVTNITVNGVSILDGPIDWTVSGATTAAAIATAINAKTSSPNYSASSAGTTVTIRAAGGSGSTPNGFAVVVSTSGTITVSSPANMSGGVTAVTALPKICTVTLGGTYEADDVFTITLAGTPYVASGLIAGTGKTALTLASKVYSTAASILQFSKVDDPSDLTGTGSGNINLSNQDGGSENLTALAIYQNQIAIFSRRSIVVYAVDPDPTKYVIRQTLRNIGTFAPRSVVSFADSDVFFLARSGVRSLRARDSSNIASVYDIGTPIDDLLREDFLSTTDEQEQSAVGVIEPRDGRFLLAVGSKVYVFSFFPTVKISAWSTYELGFTVEWWAVVDQRLFARSGNTIYLYGGVSGEEYDTSEAEVVMPLFDAKQPATPKFWQSLDASMTGEWLIECGTRTDDISVVQSAARVIGPTFQFGTVPLGMSGTHLVVRLTNNKAAEARIASFIAHFEGGVAS